MDPNSTGTLLSIWRRVPIVIRAIVVGFLVFEIGVVAWLAIAALKPAPWSIVVMGGVLWFYWKYFSGSWWPKATAEIRRDRFRAIKLPAAVWKWGLVAALLLVVAAKSSVVADILNFSYWWTDVTGTFDRRPIAETGIDAHLIVWVFNFVASVALFSWAARKTLAARRQEFGDQDGRPLFREVANGRIEDIKGQAG